MTRDDLRWNLNRAGFQPAVCSIRWSPVALCSREWVLGEFHRAVMGWARALGIQHYEEGNQNCRLYADLAKTIAHVCHARSTRAATMLAAGNLGYWRRDGIEHALVVFVHGPDAFTFYDLTEALAGNSPDVELNDQERASCYELFV